MTSFELTVTLSWFFLICAGIGFNFLRVLLSEKEKGEVFDALATWGVLNMACSTVLMFL